MLTLINMQQKSVLHNVKVIIKLTNENAATKFLTADSDTYSSQRESKVFHTVTIHK